jgi:hypothetical protein
MPFKKELAEQAMAAIDAAWVAYQEERDRIQAASNDPFGQASLAYYQSVHPLWTPEMAAVLPTENEAGNDDDPVCYYRFIAPHSGDCEWFVMAATPQRDDVILFVYACLADPENAEVGDVSLNELRSIRGPFLLNVETDRGFRPMLLSAVEAPVAARKRRP